MSAVRLGLLGLLILAQWYVPAAMIWKHERTLAHGETIKIRTAPVDPYDAFRGRYVWLGFPERTFSYTEDLNLTGPTWLYVTYETDAQGFATPVSASETRPPEGIYIYQEVMPQGPETAQAVYSFARYYLNETLAPDAERLYREEAGLESTYVTVRVLDGHAVLEELYINDTPVVDYVRRARASAERND